MRLVTRFVLPTIRFKDIGFKLKNESTLRQFIVSMQDVESLKKKKKSADKPWVLPETR